MTHTNAVAVPIRIAPKVSPMPEMLGGWLELDSKDVELTMFTAAL